jgi:hypothetical protein
VVYEVFKQTLACQSATLPNARSVRAEAYSISTGSTTEGNIAVFTRLCALPTSVHVARLISLATNTHKARELAQHHCRNQLR